MIVYMGASVISPGVPLLMRDWTKSEQTGTLVISIYVLGYAVGPSAYSPSARLLTGRSGLLAAERNPVAGPFDLCVPIVDSRG